MPEGSLGYSFAPTFENAETAKRGGSPAEFPQGSIQVLNFRLPRVAGAPGPNALSPLVGDRPSGGFGNAVLQSVLQTVLGPEAAAAVTSALPTAGGRDTGASILDELRGGYGDSRERERDLNPREPAPPISTHPPERPSNPGPFDPPPPRRDAPPPVVGTEDPTLPPRHPTEAPLSDPPASSGPAFEDVSWMDRKRAAYQDVPY